MKEKAPPSFQWLTAILLAASPVFGAGTVERPVLDAAPVFVELNRQLDRLAQPLLQAGPSPEALAVTLRSVLAEAASPDAAPARRAAALLLAAQAEHPASPAVIRVKLGRLPGAERSQVEAAAARLGGWSRVLSENASARRELTETSAALRARLGDGALKERLDAIFTGRAATEGALPAIAVTPEVPLPPVPDLPATLEIRGQLKSAGVHSHEIFDAVADGKEVVAKVGSRPSEGGVLLAMHEAAAGGRVTLADNVRLPKVYGERRLSKIDLEAVDPGEKIDRDVISDHARQGRKLLVLEKLPEDFVSLKDVLIGWIKIQPISAADFKGLVDSLRSLNEAGLEFRDLENRSNVRLRQRAGRTEWALIDTGQGTAGGRLAQDVLQLLGKDGIAHELERLGLLAARPHGEWAQIEELPVRPGVNIMPLLGILWSVRKLPCSGPSAAYYDAESYHGPLSFQVSGARGPRFLSEATILRDVTRLQDEPEAGPALPPGFKIARFKGYGSADLDDIEGREPEERKVAEGWIGRMKAFLFSLDKEARPPRRIVEVLATERPMGVALDAFLRSAALGKVPAETWAAFKAAYAGLRPAMERLHARGIAHNDLQARNLVWNERAKALTLTGFHAAERHAPNDHAAILRWDAADEAALDERIRQIDDIPPLTRPSGTLAPRG